MNSWWFEQKQLCRFKESTDSVFSYDDVMGALSDDVLLLFRGAVKGFILSVDLGQSADYTALTILERTSYNTGKAMRGKPNSTVYRNGRLIAGGAHKRYPVYKHHYAARRRGRLPLGTPDPAQLEQLSDELYKITGTRPRLAADATETGCPVMDTLRSAELRPVSVTMTGGDTVSSDGSDYRVPKQDLAPYKSRYRVSGSRSLRAHPKRQP